MKLIYKIILMLILVGFFFTLSFENTSLATEAVQSETAGSSGGLAEKYINGFEANTTGAVKSSKKLQVIVGKILGFLQVTSGIIIVIVLATTGINYIGATVDVRVELKQKMLPIIIGLILIFGAVSIAKFILSAF